MSPSQIILIFVGAVLLLALAVFLFVTWWIFFIEVPKQLKRIADALERAHGTGDEDDE